MKALGLLQEEQIRPKDFDRSRRCCDKRPYLKKFQELGWFVIDASFEPVDKKRRKERRLAIKKNIPRLKDDVRKLNPERIVIVKASIFDDVKKALERIGYREKVLNKGALPFPSHGHQKDFQIRLSKMVTTREIFLADMTFDLALEESLGP